MKKRISLIAASFILLFAPPLSVHGEDTSGYEYTIINGEVTIVGYTGEPEEIDIPEFIEGCPVTEVRDNAFYNCYSLKRINLPDTVLKIGHHSFYACCSLENVRLPNDLEEIGMGCFCGCAELKAVILPETLAILPDSCFRACTSLTEITLPQNLTMIDSFCFSGCIGLYHIETGSCIENIGERAFYMCGKLESISIPPSCRDIGKQALGYTCEGNMMIRQTEMCIIGEDDSAAERYAAENGVGFIEEEPAEEAFAEASDTVESTPKPPVWSGPVILGVLTAATFRFIFVRRKDEDKDKGKD